MHEQNRPGALDLAGYFAVQMGGHAGHATGQDLAGLGDETLEQVGVLVINGLDADVDAATRHRAVVTAECGFPFWGFRFHGVLLDLPVEGMTFEERIVLFLFQAVGSVGALFVPRGDVAGGRFVLGLGLGALDGDDVSGHKVIPWIR